MKVDKKFIKQSLTALAIGATLFGCDNKQPEKYYQIPRSYTVRDVAKGLEPGALALTYNISSPARDDNFGARVDAYVVVNEKELRQLGLNPENQIELVRYKGDKK